MLERDKLKKIVIRFNTEKNCMAAIRNKVNYEIQ